ncbi:MAG: hypothetical protein IJ282_06805 [Lachnospiraceae bacterium]|nr:hypothetical protein [Lachnospiraceae bacterium]
MLLIGVREENAWLISRWNLTYRVGWKQICKAAHSVYDYYKGLEILVDNRAVDAINKESILSLDESRTLTIRGISTIVGIPIMITFYNQTNIVDINVAQATEEFKGADYEKFNKSLCQYLDSMEIAMHQ